MTLRELQDKVWNQQVTYFQSHETEAPYYFLFRAMAELGELANQVNKSVVYGREVEDTLLYGEFGDVLYFLMLAASQQNFDLQNILKDTITRVKERAASREYGKALKDHCDHDGAYSE